MWRKARGLLYGDKSYYFSHLLLGTVIAITITLFILFVLKHPARVMLQLISDETIALSAALLGFQLAGVSVLIALDGNKKLSLLKEIESDSMLYKVFLSSITMFLISIVTMLFYLYILGEAGACTPLFYGVIGYGSLLALLFGFVFLFSSINLLKWLC